MKKRRPTPRSMSKPKTKTVELFISYSHENSAWFDRLRPVIKFNRCKDEAIAWNDQEMKAGDRWDKKIKEALKRMDVFVCLISFEFLASGYIKDVEIKEALKREKRGEVEIVPIVLYEMDLKTECSKLNTFNPLPSWGKCWRDYEKGGGHFQDAHGVIRKGLREAIDKVRARGR